MGWVPGLENLIVALSSSFIAADSSIGLQPPVVALYSSPADSKIFLSAVFFSSVKDWRGLLT